MSISLNRFKRKPERIACAAIWYQEQTTAKIRPTNIDSGVVVCGLRHADCIHIFVALTGKRSVLPECGETIQGFLTTWNRFVDRDEAATIAYACGQIEGLPSKMRGKYHLFSEHLY